MALMFSRLARNFIKNGYYPTDDVTLARILNALDIGGGELRILDPCCGEGVALAEVRHHLIENGAKVTAYGVEYDAERAWHSKKSWIRSRTQILMMCLYQPEVMGCYS